MRVLWPVLVISCTLELSVCKTLLQSEKENLVKDWAVSWHPTSIIAKVSVPILVAVISMGHNAVI